MPSVECQVEGTEYNVSKYICKMKREKEFVVEISFYPQASRKKHVGAGSNYVRHNKR